MSATQGRYPPGLQPPADPRQMHAPHPLQAQPPAAHQGPPPLSAPLQSQAQPMNWPPVVPQHGHPQQPPHPGAAPPPYAPMPTQQGYAQPVPPIHNRQPQHPPAQPPHGYAQPPQQAYAPPPVQGHAPPAAHQGHQAEAGWTPQPPQPFPPPVAGRGEPQTRAQQTLPPQLNGPGQAPVHGFPPQSRMADPASYDFGNYGLHGNVPPAPPPSARAPQGPDPRTQPPSQRDFGSSNAQGGWSGAPAADGFGYPQPGSPPPQGAALGQRPQTQGSLPNAAQMHAPLAGQFGAPQTSQQQEAALADKGYEDDEYEDPPRRSRRWLIVAALVGSIGLGGGMAYAYKKFFDPKQKGATEVVRAPREPAKATPSDRGGRQLANTGSPALNNRLPSEGSANAPGGEASVDSNGVRRVSTVKVDREPTQSVPGLMLAPTPGGFPSPGGFPAPGGVTAAAPPPLPPQRQAAVPITTVPAASPPPSARPAAATAEPPPAPAIPRQKLVSREPAGAGAAADKPKPTGVVAVLGYRRSQLDAMKALADVQQRYDVLRNKKLEIVQSDETSRGLGVIYRIVVGPKGSMASAREVCTQLTQAGMPAKDCYTLAY